MRTAFKVLASLKGLRGGVFDIFGRTEERKAERALIGEYRATIEEVLRTLNVANHGAAVEIARIPEQIKGFGHVKARNLKTAREVWSRAMVAWRETSGTRQST